MFGDATDKTPFQGANEGLGTRLITIVLLYCIIIARSSVPYCDHNIMTLNITKYYCESPWEGGPELVMAVHDHIPLSFDESCCQVRIDIAYMPVCVLIIISRLTNNIT